MDKRNICRCDQRSCWWRSHWTRCSRIDPQHFNLQAQMGSTMRIAGAAALINALIGVAAYLQKSPLPQD